MKPRIVPIFVTTLTQWHTLREIVDALSATGLVKPQVYFIDDEADLDLKQLSKDYLVFRISKAEKNYRDVFLVDSATYPKLQASDKYATAHRLFHWSWVIAPLRNFVKKIPGYSFVRKGRGAFREALIINREVKNLKKREEYFISLLYKLQSSTVIVPGDRGLGDQPPLLSACNKLNILTVIAPTAFSCPVEILARTRTHRKFQASKDFAQRYPDQVWKDVKTGRIISFFPERDTRALNKANMLPQNPKILGGSRSGLVLVDSEASKINAIDGGVACHKIVVTGNPDTDRLYSAYKEKLDRKNQLIEQYALDRVEEVVILNLPLFDDVGMSPSEESLVHKEILSEVGLVFPSFLLSAHPRMSRDYQEHLSTQFSIKILEERLSNVLPLADVYITDQTSSTIFWAILADVPTISLNWGWYSTPKLVKDIQGVKLSTSSIDFRNALKLLSAKHEQTKIRSGYAESRHLYGPFDGNSMRRITDTIIHSKITTHNNIS